MFLPWALIFACALWRLWCLCFSPAFPCVPPASPRQSTPLKMYHHHHHHPPPKRAYKGKDEDENGRRSAPTSARQSFSTEAVAAAQPTTSPAAVAPMASGVTPGGSRGGGKAPAEIGFKAFSSALAGPPRATPRDAPSSPSSSSSSRSPSDGDEGNKDHGSLPAIVVGDNLASRASGGVFHADHCGDGIELPAAVTMASGSGGVLQPQKQHQHQHQPQHKHRQTGWSNRVFPSEEFLTEKALGSFQSSPATR